MPKVTPGKIKPSQGLSALLRNICKINVPSHTKNTTAIPANRKAGRKNTVYFTLLILVGIPFTIAAAIFSPLSIKQFSNINLAPDKTGRGIFHGKECL